MIDMLKKKIAFVVYSNDSFHMLTEFCLFHDDSCNLPANLCVVFPISMFLIGKRKTSHHH